MVEFLLIAFVVSECIVFIYLWKIAIKYLKSGNYHSIKTADNKSNTKANKTTNQKNNKTTNQTKSSWLFSEHNDPDEENKKELIKNGVYDETSFEEEELEEDDYHYEDD